MQGGRRTIVHGKTHCGGVYKDESLEEEGDEGREGGVEDPT